MSSDTDEGKTKMESPSPKLSLFSLPRKPAETSPGMLTPPIQQAAAVPFLWEEAPGRPKPPRPGGRDSDPKPASARCLDLPPRLLNFESAAKVSSMPSPTTVLDGPYVSGGGRSLSSTWSFRIGGSFRSPEGRSKRFEVKEKPLFGSTRWGILKERSGAVGDGGEEDETLSAVFAGDDGCDGGSGGETKVKITRVKRRGSFLKLSNSKSHLWASIYESIKQVVPWRRRQQRKAEEKSAQAQPLSSSPNQ